MPAEQNYSNHTRFDPPYHFFLLPGILILLGLAIWNVVRHGFHIESLWLLIASLLFAVIGFKVRTYALKAQDRVIRLEERLRLHQLLPAAQHMDIYKLTEGQLIALRFCSDAELPALASRAASQGLGAGDIKKAISGWRADNFRI
jgi:Family of unknown function (DUF6526)